LERIVEDLEPGTARIRRWMILIVPVFVAAVVLGIAALYSVSDPSARKDLVSTLMNPAISLPGVIGGGVVPWIAARQARFKRVRGGECIGAHTALQGDPGVPQKESVRVGTSFTGS
jgi:hypothetical protein